MDYLRNYLFNIFCNILNIFPILQKQALLRDYVTFTVIFNIYANHIHTHTLVQTL